MAKPQFDMLAIVSGLSAPFTFAANAANGSKSIFGPCDAAPQKFSFAMLVKALSGIKPHHILKKLGSKPGVTITN